MQRNGEQTSAPSADPEALWETLGREALDKLDAFEALLKRWNKRCNLVSRGDLPRLRERHMLDSLALLPWCEGPLADIGSGGGFPGLPLAIACPQRRVVLIERSLRKCLFLRQAVIELALANVEVVNADAGRYQPSQRFSTAVARAVAPPAKAWRLLRPLLRPSGTALLQSRIPLAETVFEGGTIHDARQQGAGWVTAVRVQDARDRRESGCHGG